MEKQLYVTYKCDDELHNVPMKQYCEKLAKRNQVVLYKLEQYLGEDLKTNVHLSEIRSLLLSVSGDIERLPDKIK